MLLYVCSGHTVCVCSEAHFFQVLMLERQVRFELLGDGLNSLLFSLLPSIGLYLGFCTFSMHSKRFNSSLLRPSLFVFIFRSLYRCLCCVAVGAHAVAFCCYRFCPCCRIALGYLGLLIIVSLPRHQSLVLFFLLLSGVLFVAIIPAVAAFRLPVTGPALFIGFRCAREVIFFLRLPTTT